MGWGRELVERVVSVVTEQDQRGVARAIRFAAPDAAVVVIDVQNDFCHPDGLLARQGRDVARTHQPIARLAAFLDDARRAAVPVILVQNIHSPNSDTPGWRARHLDSGRDQSCQEGMWGAEFFEVGPEPGDHVVVKHRYDAFTRTSLEELLRSLGRSSVLYTGVSTSICVESSLRAGVCRDFLGTLVHDCCGAYNESAHQRAIDAVQLGFGIVASSDEISQAWSHASSGDPAEALTQFRTGT